MGRPQFSRCDVLQRNPLPGRGRARSPASGEVARLAAALIASANDLLGGIEWKPDPRAAADSSSRMWAMSRLSEGDSVARRLGENLLAQREEAGMSQEALGRRA